MRKRNPFEGPISGGGGGPKLNRKGLSTGPRKKLGPEDDAPPPVSMRNFDLPPTRQASASSDLTSRLSKRPAPEYGSHIGEADMARIWKELGVSPPPKKFRKGGMVKGRDYAK